MSGRVTTVRISHKADVALKYLRDHPLGFNLNGEVNRLILEMAYKQRQADAYATERRKPSVLD